MISVQITEERYMELLRYEAEHLRRAKRTEKNRKCSSNDIKSLTLNAAHRAMITDKLTDRFLISTAREEFRALRPGATIGANNLAFQRGITALRESGAIVATTNPKVFKFNPESKS